MHVMAAEVKCDEELERKRIFGICGGEIAEQARRCAACKSDNLVRSNVAQHVRLTGQ